MATYEYDDFRVTLTPRPDGTYDVRAVGDDGVEHAATFTVPLSKGDLEAAVLGLAETHSQTRRLQRGTAAPPAAVPVRDIGGGGPPRLDAQQLGAALADALLGDDMGRRYDEAVARAEAEGRGLRLSLSLAGAPELLNLPWEFLYRRPRFLASQRQSPLVRHLDTGTPAPPPRIEATVRMLGVIADPNGLTPLDVASERQRVEQAVAMVADLGRVQLDWLEPATPRTLRQKLRDDSYHILHYVGHSDFTDDGEGVLFLEDTDGGAAPVDSTALANLLSDQSRLRLVVLNSCDGARTTLVDPYAGVATTLIQLGVPAVVAMQFEITDRAAILFADELYTNLIGRQDPIDAAVAEARKAIYIEVDKVEWATPVLFVRNPDVQLFNFEVEAAPLPRPRPIEHEEPPPPPLPPPLPPPIPPPSPWKRWAAIGAGAVVIVVAAVLLVTSLGGGDDGGGGGGGERGDPVLAETIAVPDMPFRVAALDSTVWVTNMESTTVTRIDISTGDQVPVEIGGTPVGVAATEDSGVWVANSTDSTVVHIDPVTNDTVSVSVADNPRNLLVASSGVWVAAYDADAVTRIDLSTGNTVDVSVGGGPRSVAEGDGSIWVTNSDDGTVSRIDPSTNDEVVPPIEVGGFVSGITATPGYVWVTNADDETVVQIDTSTNEVVDRILVDEDPGFLATDGSDVWVTGNGSDTVSRIDAATGRVTFTVPVGDAPEGLDVTSDSLWVAEAEGDSVSRIDLG